MLANLAVYYGPAKFIPVIKRWVNIRKYIHSH